MEGEMGLSEESVDLGKKFLDKVLVFFEHLDGLEV